ncbi:MAG: DUF4175 family protein, partial [Acidobacteriota bacterium]
MLEHADPGTPSDLVQIIRDVRRRWRVKLALAGAARFLAAAAATLVVAAFALETVRFSPGAILAGRILTVAALAGFAAWFIVRPLRRRVTDDQVALYLEEHEPSLDLAVVSAWQARSSGLAEQSPALVRRLVEQAVERCHSVEEGRRVERGPTRRYAGAAAAVVAAAVMFFAFGPPYLRHALSAMFAFTRSVEAAAPYRIDVTPGHATVPKGADQAVTALASGFDAADAALVLRRGDATAFERVPMLKGENGAFDAMLFDLAEPIEYFVEAAGVRSPVFTLEVAELPYARQVDLEYRFPAYTGLPPRTVEDGGDIAALKGTEVEVRVTPTMPTGGGRLVIDEKTSVPLTRQPDGRLTAALTVAAAGFYRIELQGPAGEAVTASPQYTIDVLNDQMPTVRMATPGRDTAATPVEEFFVEAQADDDFAVRELQLVYSVNGGPEKTVPLFRGARPLAEVTAGHTFYLEELGVEAGDSVSYYARALDNDGVGGAKAATSDIYFLRIRPFGKDFRQALSQGGGGGGG